MEYSMSDVMIHFNENTTHDDREVLRDTLLQLNGVMAADVHDNRPHLMVIAYDPELIGSQELLSTMQANSMHAQLVGL